jgi:hypothetical protein
MNSQIYMLYVTKLRKESLNNSTHINTTIIIWEKLIMAYDGGNRGPSINYRNIFYINTWTQSTCLQISYCLCIYVFSLDIMLSVCCGWDPVIRFNPVTLCVCNNVGVMVNTVSKTGVMAVHWHRSIVIVEKTPGPIKLMLCLRNGPIALMLFTEGTHQPYFVYPMNPSNLIAYSMDTSNLRYLQYGSIKRMLFTEWTHQAYSVKKTFVWWVPSVNNISLIGPIHKQHKFDGTIL